MDGMDASVLTLVLHPEAKSPCDPVTGKPIPRAKDRVDHLLATLQQANRKIVIPTPVLSEVLVRTGKEGLGYIHLLQKSEFFDIRPFDEIAAIELSEINRRAIAEGNKTAKSEAPYQKIKVDRQIVSICKMAGVQVLYACDRVLMNFAKQAGLRVCGLHELPLPPDPQTPPQLDIFSYKDGNLDAEALELHDEED
ncbi:hypothetical protein KKP04_12475 [Rhodomicrobium sp. Az07]|uniref:hypothetical protein n=1 Tax=Rhodomicrobium sp. Az07 TaxID=2839034 RepID=UPI001BE7414B|nr:hypothetical protein [Rhodomicrobium sp. Az07]MBT3071678.1 hypothetical protein [Rhodomicrobium sp. Az07]